MHLLLFLPHKTFRRGCFLLSDAPGHQKPWYRVTGEQAAVWGPSSLLTVVLCYCGAHSTISFPRAVHCCPSLCPSVPDALPVTVQYNFQGRRKDGFKTSPAGVRRWHREVSPVPERLTVPVPRQTGRLVTECPCGACLRPSMCRKAGLVGR